VRARRRRTSSTSTAECAGRTADDDVLATHVAASGEVRRALTTVLGLELQAHERLVVDGAHAHDLPVVEALPFESLLDRAQAALLSH
jgi:hypothetical protein